MKYKLVCCNCVNEYETDCIIDSFCSGDCEREYWGESKEDIQIEITTVCPECKEEFSRKVYTINVVPLQALVYCPDCVTLKSVEDKNYKNSYIDNIKIDNLEYDLKDMANVIDVTLESVLDKYPLLYHENRNV